MERAEGINVVLTKGFPGGRRDVTHEIQGFANDNTRPIAVLGGELIEGGGRKEFRIETAVAVVRKIGAARRTIKAALEQGVIDVLIDNATTRTEDAWRMYQGLSGDSSLEVRQAGNSFVVRLKKKRKPFWRRIFGW